ncbi:hypothetical protein ACSBL2_09675 [Pedobacter sp. AW31-3R]|uniref:hypothetical protein n=1 Tax=Pedobacter sp. AW31-3R TaxID=3445781 RepID=UPI003F9F313D
MKHISLFAVCMLFKISAFCQEGAAVLDLAFPEGTVKINKEQFIDFSTKRFPSPSSLTVTEFFFNLYQKDNILVYLRNTMASVTGAYSLEIKQKEMVSLVGQAGYATDISFRILIFNEVRFLVVKYKHNGYYTFRFISDHDSKERYMYGDILFDMVDADKAEDYLQTFLKTMHFKK